MAIVGLLVSVLGRDVPRYTPLFLAAGWILLGEPEALLGASFQLSFGATLSILILLPFWERRRSGARAWRFIQEAALLGVAVHIGIWPILVYYFHRLSFGGFIANWTVFPMSGVLMILGLSIGTWGVFAPTTVPQVLLRVVHIAVHWTLLLIQRMAAWRYVVQQVESPSWTTLGLYYGFLFGILLMVHRRKIHVT